MGLKQIADGAKQRGKKVTGLFEENKFLAVGAIALLALILSIVSSSTFQGCIRANGSLVGSAGWCVGIYFTENGAAITAIATIVMAAFTGTLWWSTASTGELTRKTVDLAEKQFLMEGQQADLAAKQHGLARIQFLALNRPIIEIRSIALGSSGKGGLLFQSGFPIKGSLVIRNTGGTAAKILEAEYRFFMSLSGLPMRPPLDHGTTKPLMADLPQNIEPHGSCLVEIESDALGGEARYIDIPSRSMERRFLWVIGAIKYSDVEGKERWMGFCREYTPAPMANGEGAFLPMQNPDYEYQD